MTITWRPAPIPTTPQYSGPTAPTAYDPNWQTYINLTPVQIAWFQAQPDWQNFVAWVALDPATATINAGVSAATIDATLLAAGQTPEPPTPLIAKL